MMRLAAAHVRRLNRGAWLPTPVWVGGEFANASSSAALWHSSASRLCHPGEPGSTTSVLHNAYKMWAGEVGRMALGRTKFAEALRSIAPDLEFRDQSKRRVWGLVPLQPAEWVE
jgi:hypothetical protein